MVFYSLLYFLNIFSLKPMTWVPCGILTPVRNATVQSRAATYELQTT